MTYQETYKAWQDDPETYWMTAAEGVDWFKKPSKALFDEKAPLYEWFSDGQCNTCYNAVDRHVEAGRGDQVAII
ncbi:MAG: acetyl-coenzyme A synthetase N-terminal domain-containing protein, partial [Mangrovicoccus sp.]